ncbi:hypothetical protein K0M31_009677 [Melipona bicolor]|uniref:Uncharacterized protein n=1 Tax=Melipona bicolor TaxID=60889 RepID=A0AA40FNQ0_9HYME|nr:hypothetical protein K0M31_009677 [Melipona bicolor]
MEIPSGIIPVDLRHQSHKPSDLLPQQRTVISTATTSCYPRQRISSSMVKIPSAIFERIQPLYNIDVRFLSEFIPALSEKNGVTDEEAIGVLHTRTVYCSTDE